MSPEAFFVFAGVSEIYLSYYFEKYIFLQADIV